MRIFKYLSLLLCSFCLLSTSFSSAFNLTSDQISLLDQMALSSGSVNNESLPVLYEIPNPVTNDYKSLCVVFSGFERSSDFSWLAIFQDTAITRSNTPYYGVPLPYGLTCASGWRKTFYLATSSTSSKFTIDRFRVLDSADLMSAFGSTSGGGSIPDCSQDTNYLQCLESLNSANGTISTLSGSLASCQSDLTNCTNGNDVLYQQCVNDKENCLTSLSSLSGQYLSCVNYSSSLSDQLQECLSTGLSGDLSSVVCNTYDLNRYDSSNNILCVNIDNSLRLPRGYMGYLSEGVLGIKPINTLENAVSIDDGDFQKVMNSYGVIFLFLFSSGLFLMFLFVIRKYFIGLKS